MAEPRSWWARAASIRARSTIVAVVVVGVTLAVGSLGLIHLLGDSLREGVESTAEAQVGDITSLLRVGPLPAQLPAGRGDTFTQVVAADGTVLASSPTLVPDRPISRRHPGEEGIVIADLPVLSSATDDDGDGDGPYLLLARTVDLVVGGRSEAVTVYVAGSLRPMTEATSTVGIALASGLPALVALVGVLVWYLTGRALRPVEAIRAQVADISLHDLHRRVPTPGVVDEVGRLARTMNEMLDRLESSSDAQRRFVADASHELRSPLTALQATLEVALAHPDDAGWQAAAADALDEARRLHLLVEDLLALARAEESGPRPARRELVDLDEIVFREARLSAASGRVNVDLGRVSGGRVRGDAGQLTRVVRNLLDNARRHAGSAVAVEVSAGDDEVLLAVSDDGEGIPEAQRDRVFERFARLDEARAPEGGTGLGLAIVRELVVAHGGRVDVVDGERRGPTCGVRFEVRLPNADRPG